MENLKNNKLVTELLVPKDNSPESRKEATMNRISLDKIRIYKDLLGVESKTEGEKFYCEMNDRINQLDINMTSFIKLFFESNSDLAEFLSFHCTTQSFVLTYLEKYKKAAIERKHVLPKDEKLIALVKMFSGVPVVYRSYPDISVTYDEERRVLAIEDKCFTVTGNERKAKAEAWSNARVIKLKDM